jgi:flagellar basal-body rod protein FlgB
LRAEHGDRAARQGVAMLFYDIANSGSIPAMEKMLAYTQARHRMLTENIANADTPGYKAKQLDARVFQRALRKAIDEQNRGSRALRVEDSKEFSQDAGGQMVVKPTVEPAENVLFHDQTNMRIERQMALLAENTLMHQMVTDRLKGRFDQLMIAIRGRVS